MFLPKSLSMVKIACKNIVDYTNQFIVMLLILGTNKSHYPNDIDVSNHHLGTAFKPMAYPI